MRGNEHRPVAKLGVTAPDGAPRVKERATRVRDRLKAPEMEPVGFDRAKTLPSPVVEGRLTARELAIRRHVRAGRPVAWICEAYGADEEEVGELGVGL